MDKILFCDLCEEELDTCTGCGAPFDLDQEIVCHDSGHFCDSQCFADENAAAASQVVEGIEEIEEDG